ncbi:MAG TPA: CHAD domain-containing protein, partial [Arenibaculum sp.]|nr:CHAD domain-containing protein [Arenibaculum sp.]
SVLTSEGLTSNGLHDIVPRDVLPAIRPVFSTDFQRTVLVLRPGPGVEIEMALDTGEVRAGARRDPVSEVELELKAGPLGGLFDLALELLRVVPVRIATRSKAEAGFALTTGEPPRPRVADPPAVTPATSVAEGFRHVVRGCMSHMLANEACALAGDDPEGLHQMRVALRRLRSAFALFCDTITAPDARDLVGEMRWLAGRLAPARDWDVLHGQLFGAFAERNAGDADVTALGEAVALSCAAARAHAAEAIRGPRYTAFLLTLGGWLEDGRWHAAADAGQRQALDRPLGAWAAGWLEDRRRKALKAGRHVKRLDETERHRLRVRLKKLRYAVEFLRGLHPPGAVGPYLDALETVQAVLGDLNDISTARRMTTALAQEADRPVRDAAERFTAWLDRRLRKRLDILPDAWKALEHAGPFWV